MIERTEPKVIKIHYYAVLREERGLSEESLSTNAKSAKELYEELKNRYEFSMPISKLNLAVNDEFSNWDTSINSGDVITFIPPVAGG